MSYQNVKNTRTRLKERIVYVMGGECQCCGYNKVNSALELHHLNPEEKDFALGANTNISWATAKSEICKCILVCANCHREIHAGLIKTEDLKSSFSEERAAQIDTLIDDIKHRKIHYCENCGVEIDRDASLCVKCYALSRRVAERPTRQELKNLIRTQSFTKIAQMFQVSDNAIRKWCIAEDLPYKAREIKLYSDDEWEDI